MLSLFKFPCGFRRKRCFLVPVRWAWVVLTCTPAQLCHIAWVFSRDSELTLREMVLYFSEIDEDGQKNKTQFRFLQPTWRRHRVALCLLQFTFPVILLNHPSKRCPTAKRFSHAISVFQLHLILLIISHMSSLTGFSWPSPRPQFRGGTWVWPPKHSLWLLVCHPALQSCSLAQPSPPLPAPLSPQEVGPRVRREKQRTCCGLQWKGAVEMPDGDHYHLSLPAKRAQLSMWLSLSAERVIVTCCPFEIKPVPPPNFSVCFLSLWEASKIIPLQCISVNKLPAFCINKNNPLTVGKMIITQCLFTPYPAPPNSAAHVNLKEENITGVGRKKTSCHKELSWRSLTSTES